MSDADLKDKFRELVRAGARTAEVDDVADIRAVEKPDWQERSGSGSLHANHLRGEEDSGELGVIRLLRTFQYERVKVMNSMSKYHIDRRMYFLTSSGCDDY